MPSFFIIFERIPRNPNSSVVPKNKEKRHISAVSIILIVHELVFHSQHGLDTVASQFGHVSDAIPTFQQQNDLLILDFVAFDV